MNCKEKSPCSYEQGLFQGDDGTLSGKEHVVCRVSIRDRESRIIGKWE